MTTCLTYTQGESNVISSFHIYASCFRYHDVGQALRNVCYFDIISKKLAIMPAHCCAFNCTKWNTVTFR